MVAAKWGGGPANIVTEKDGIPVLYPMCNRGFGIRIIFPTNPKAPSKDFCVNMLRLAPGGVMEPHSHENEEADIILEGEGIGFFGLGKPVSIKKGMFIHLPPNAEHGLENTGDEMMKVLVVSAPPFSPIHEWDRKKPVVAHKS